MSRKIPIPDKKELEERYSGFGVTISSLAREYGTSNPTIRNWLKKYGIPLKTHKQASSESNNRHKIKNKPSREDLEAAYLNMSLKHLESLYGVGQDTVYEWLREYNISREEHGKRCEKFSKKRRFFCLDHSKEEIESLYTPDKTIQSLADELGVDRLYIRKIFKEYGIVANQPTRSDGEIRLYEYCRSMIPSDNWEYGNRSVISPLELDIINTELKIAIEYCGLYWHSEMNGSKEKQYHADKFFKCREQGYKLLTVFASDNEEKVKALIKTSLGLNKRVYARNTVVKLVSASDARLFHDKHHLSGAIGAKYHIGLYYYDDLVMLISFGKSRFNKKYEYECTRMTSHSDYTVIGGASKLYKFFIRKFDPESIITYADLRFGDGNVYSKCGLSFKGYTGPNYWYFHKYNHSVLYSRGNFQKHKLKDKLDHFNPEATEYENMLINGWDRIWDCGNSVYVYEKGRIN